MLVAVSPTARGAIVIVEDQSAVVAFMADPSSHSSAAEVDRIETHISEIFLVGDHAYKLKRAIKLPYADFSTPEIRYAACKKELWLNKEVSPDIYIRVRRITQQGGTLEFDGDGELVDAVVEMHRFDQERILDQMALNGELTEVVMTTLAREISASHRHAEIACGDGVSNIERVLDINWAGFHESTAFSSAEIERLDTAFRTKLETLAPLLRRRAARGCIRRCHGDLHLRNICMFNGRPQLFDCIDFNDELATVDVLYDLAFLAMDLWHRGMKDFSSLVVNHYLDASIEEEDGYACLPFFIALRAAVRAHVMATQAKDQGKENADRTREEARSYYEFALSLLNPMQAELIAIGGLSGSGKSTIAGKIAPLMGHAPGARLIESDRTRKAMFGVAPEKRLPQCAYAKDSSDKVYALMSKRTTALLKSGCAVVADAVFDIADRRSAIETAAVLADAPFHGVWLVADPETLKQRIETRPKAASDATPHVLEIQLARDCGTIEWTRIVSSDSIEQTVENVRQLLEG